MLNKITIALLFIFAIGFSVAIPFYPGWEMVFFILVVASLLTAYLMYLNIEGKNITYK